MAQEEMEALASERHSLKETLEKLLTSESLDEKGIEATAEKLFEAEKKYKLRELESTAAINSYLTAEQRKNLIGQQIGPMERRQQFEMGVRNIRRHISQENFPANRLSAISAQLEKAMQVYHANGPEEAISQIQKIGAQLGQGGAAGENQSPPQRKKASTAASNPPVPPKSIASSDELGKAIDALRIKKIAWRGIDWKHCILDGIEASREEDKPIIFWCHIDLPADDKRC